MSPTEKRMRYDSATAFCRQAQQHLSMAFNGDKKVLNIKIAHACFCCALEELDPLEEFLEIPIEQMHAEVLHFIERARAMQRGLVVGGEVGREAIKDIVEGQLHPVGAEQECAIYNFQTGERMFEAELL